jgi:NAD(P)H dehydrogenase (quinone)
MTIAVTGAAGWLGGLSGQMLIDQLGADQVILITRRPEALDEGLRESGAHVRRADFEDPASLAHAFDGAEKAFIISADHTVTPRRVEAHRAVFEAAKNAGVQHIAFPSMPKVDEDHPTGEYAQEYPASENLLKELGIGWTVLQNGPYAEGVIPRATIAAATGELTSNAGEGRTAPVSHADCARVAVAVLTSPGHEEKTYVVTGSELFSQPELAALFSEVTGREIRCAPISDEDHPAKLRELGLPAPFDVYLPRHLKAIRLGYFDDQTTVVKDVTGREPERLRDILEAHRDEMLAAAGTG